MALTVDDLTKINNSINDSLENVDKRSISSLEIEKPYLIITLSLKKSIYGRTLATKMWMQYASEHWAKPIDLNTAIERLGSELRCLSFDSAHASNYDTEYCYFEDQVKRLEEDSEMYNNGSILCDEYNSGILNLEQFCKKMVEIGLIFHLKGYLLRYLPNTIIQKYQLKDQDDEQ